MKTYELEFHEAALKEWRSLDNSVQALFNNKDCWPVLRKYFGSVRPMSMMISAGLLDPRMKIEMEVTALRQAA